MNLETYSLNITTATTFSALPLITQRRFLHHPTKPNPVTKVAERFAEPEVVRNHIGREINVAGTQFLNTVHQEIFDAQPEWMKTAEADRQLEVERKSEQKWLATLVAASR